jgi:hypothetical protein
MIAKLSEGMENVVLFSAVSIFCILTASILFI